MSTAMTVLHGALDTFWSQFEYSAVDIPAHPINKVPSTATYPYITYDPIVTEPFGETLSTAFVWVKREGLWDVQLAAILDSIAAAIPTQGVAVSLTGGHLILTRNPANFQSYYDDPNDPTIAGGRVSYFIRSYNL